MCGELSEGLLGLALKMMKMIVKRCHGYEELNHITAEFLPLWLQGHFLFLPIAARFCMRPLLSTGLGPKTGRVFKRNSIG